MQSRVPRGVPSGGEYAPMLRAEQDLDLSATGWPAVETETLDWRDSWRTYQASVLPDIADLSPVDLLDHETIAEVAVAQQAVVSFDEQMTAEFGGMELGTVDTLLMRSEASSSSQIEHLTVSAKQLALAEVGMSRSPNARLIQGNVVAMSEALADGAGFDTESAVEMQSHILADTGLHVGLRTEQVWIGTRGDSPVGADYVAPRFERVPQYLEDLWRFMDQDTPLPLAQAAVAHAQFESIHPFVDGNGRVGRALVHRYLRRSGLTSHVTVPISAGLLTDPRGYVDALGSYRNGDIVPIVQAFSRASTNAAAIGKEMLTELRSVRASWNERITARSDSVAWRIADGLIGQPAVTTESAATRFGTSLPAARAGISSLVDAGVLRKASTGNRNQVWVAEEVTSCYDRVAILVGRRKPY